MSTATSQTDAGQKKMEARMLIVVLLIGFLAVVGFRYHLHASMPKGDPEFIRPKATDADMPPTDGNMLTAPPL